MGFNPFTLFSKQKSFIDFRGATDWHSHILPGVDDGVSDLETSLEILARYEELGFRRVWLTPHIMEDIPNRPDDLKDRFANLKAAYDGPIKLKLAAENMMDELFVERLEARVLLPIGDRSDSLLVETSYFTPPANLFGIIDSIFSSGYFPVLAHAERYVYMDQRHYDRLHERGVRMQLNLLSLSGNYGKAVTEKAYKLLDLDYYDRAGSDIHRFAQLEALSNLVVGKKHGEKLADLLNSSLS